MRPEAASAIRGQLILAMEKRALGLQGEARRALDARLVELRALDAAALDEAPDAHAIAPHQSPLRELVADLAGEASPERAAYPQVPALAEFRQLWSALRADHQLQQSVAQMPTGAGPLNSTALASRAIALMRELSPGYLRSLLAYVDDLAWLETLGNAQPATGTAAPKRRASRKPRI